MKTSTLIVAAAVLVFATALSTGLHAQDNSSPTASNAATPSSDPAESEPLTAESTTADSEPAPDIADKAGDLATETQAKVEEIAEKVDQNETAQKAADGVLGPIYKLAESLNFAAFHWLAFAIMASGVVSFALQLVLGKLALLFRGSLNLCEIFSDAIGLIISVVGLVLTTQAAAENSTFTHSPAAVLSAAATGVIFGFVLYRWGQAQEVHALTGRRLNPDAK